MLKLFTSCMAAGLLLTSPAFAQQKAAVKKGSGKAYARLGVGYGFTHAGQTTVPVVTGGVYYVSGTQDFTIGASGQTEKLTVNRISFGTGGTLTAAGGYMITPHIGLELGITAILLPTEYKFTTTTNGSTTANSNRSTKAQVPLYIIPALLFTTNGPGARVYARMGLALPISNRIRTAQTYTNNSAGIAPTVYEFELTNSFSIGFQAAAGLNYPVTDRVALWGEVTGISRNAYAKKLEMTGYTVNGVNQLSKLPTSQKVVEYEFDRSYSSSASNPNAPTKYTTSSIPYSSIGLSIGVKLEL